MSNKKKNTRALLLLLATIFSMSLFAQSVTLTGNVSDPAGEPVIGASILEKGTSNGVITDIDGNFSLKITGNQPIVVSYVGMKTQEVSIQGKSFVSIVLQDDAQALEEVVVVGYGVQRKKDLTGSVSTVGGGDLTKIPVTSAAAALAGKVAGVSVATADGAPDAEVKIRVRGGGSITQDNSPLYIVDGFPVNNFSDVSLADIESMTILKDASSTAIYGARGANGVVMITTKQGKEGKINVSLNTYLGVRKIAKTLDVLDPYEYVLWQYELAGPSGTAADNVKRFYGDYGDYELYQNQKAINWQDEVFGKTAFTQNYNINVSGGNERTRFSLGLTRADEEGIMVNSGMERNNVNLNLNTKINNQWSFDFNSRFTNYVVDGSGTSSSNSTNAFLRHAIQYPTTTGLADILGSEIAGADIESYSSLINPLAVINDTYRQLKRNTLAMNGAVNFKFLSDFTFRSEWGTEIQNQKDKKYYGSNAPYTMNYGAYPIAIISDYEANSYRIANTLTYLKEINKIHNLNVMIGQEVTSSTSKTIQNEVRYFPMGTTKENAFAMMNQGTAEPVYTYEAPDNNMVSVFGRLNYSLLDRYLLTATFRSDGSSKFAKGNQWGHFPSVAMAWRASEEAFMEPVDWVSNLKARLSFGMAGNNRIADNLWKMTYTSDLDGKYYTYSQSDQNQLRPGTTLSNPKLKWETTLTRNFGLDMGFFNNRLNAIVDLYWNTTKDLLIQAAIPSSTGYSVQMQNIGQTSNKGIEISLDALLINKRDFSLSASFNIAFNKNKIDKLGADKSLLYESGWYGTQGPTGEYLIREGRSTGLMYGYVTEGMYSFDDFNYDQSTGTYSLKEGIASSSALIGGGRYFGPGALKLKDLNEDGELDSVNDREVIGNANPKHTGGFSVNATWKNFDLTAQFNWSYGNDVYNANKLNFTSYPGSRTFQNIYSTMSTENRFVTFDKTGEYTGVAGSFVTDPETLKAMNKNATIWSPMTNNLIMHSWAVEDGSFLRLNNLTVGYSLPKSVMNKLKINQIRIYASGYNLWTWTKYTGYDPEVDVFNSSPLTPNVDYSAYPRSRTFVGGVNINF